MTDKEIIIDGIDVSKCGHYHYGKCEIDYDEWNNEIIRYNECQNNPNCYFKQLKPKEQECEELKKTVMYKCPQCGEEYLSPIGASLYEENNNLKEEKAKYYQQTLDVEIQINELLQTLAEIKEIAEENIRIADLEGLNGVYRRGLAKQILQKISEVENE